MRGFSLLKNMVFDWDGALYRIDRVSPNDEVLLERLEDGRLIIAAGRQLLDEYRDGRIQARSTSGQPTSPNVYSRPLDDLTAPARQEVERRAHYMRRLLEDGKPNFRTAEAILTVNDIAAAIGDKNPPSAATLYRWYSRYNSEQGHARPCSAL